MQGVNMGRSDDKGILRVPMASILGLEDAVEDPSLDVDNEGARQRRAEIFRDWLGEAIPERLKEYVCFVDYTVFQDAKIKNPYFYLVAPTQNTKEQYQAVVEKLVEGTDQQKDCFSVAYHPEFVGIRTGSDIRNTYMVIPLMGAGERTFVSSDATCSVDGRDWVPGFYPLWPKSEIIWPPTTKEALNRICGQHSLKECLERFQTILNERRQHISDSLGRPVSFVFCLPFLVSNQSSSLSRSNLPFSEIAAALFLGVSFEGTAQQTVELMGFVRTLALRTYRIAGMKKAEQAGEATGQAEGKVLGLEQAIESFAHQIKGVANAMSTKWAVTLEKWDEIKDIFRDDPSAVKHLGDALVLPAPELIEAITQTLILWSQTRRIDDLYYPRPTRFEDVINRAWDFTSRIRFALGNISRNLGESLFDLKKVWGQNGMMARPAIDGDVETQWGDWVKIDLEAEGRLCSVTRLMVAIFDNATEHGVRDKPPEVTVAFDNQTKIVSIVVSNKVGSNEATPGSRLRIGMQGNDVLRSLAEQLDAKLTIPDTPKPRQGEDYVVTVRIPSLSIFFTQSTE
jgi:hypothetical protein